MSMYVHHLYCPDMCLGAYLAGFVHVTIVKNNAEHGLVCVCSLLPKSARHQLRPECGKEKNMTFADEILHCPDRCLVLLAHSFDGTIVVTCTCNNRLSTQLLSAHVIKYVQDNGLFLIFKVKCFFTTVKFSTLQVQPAVSCKYQVQSKLSKSSSHQVTKSLIQKSRNPEIQQSS